MYGQYSRQQSSPGRLISAPHLAEVSVDAEAASQVSNVPAIPEHGPATTVAAPLHSRHIVLEQAPAPRPQQDQPNYMFVDLRTNMGNRYLLRVRDTDTIERIKVKICARLDIPVRQQQLLMNGVELYNHQTVPECGITDSTTLMLVPKLSSGPLRLQVDEQSGDEMVVVESVAAHLTDPKVRNAVANGQPLSFVALIGGRYMMVRLNKTPQDNSNNNTASLSAASSPAVHPARVQRCTCSCAHPAASPAARASPSPSPAPEQQVHDDATERIMRENVRTRERIAEIRARLQHKKSSSSRASSAAAAAAPSAAASQPEASPLSAAPASSSPSSPASPTSSTSMDVDVPSSPVGSPGKAARQSRRSRCANCPAKLGLVQYPCKCGNLYCSAHKQPYEHNCTFDYRQL